MEQPIAPDQAGAPMPGAQPQEAPAATHAPGGLGEMQQASPEEQQQYEHFIAKAYELTYSKPMLPKIVDMLAGAGDPMEGLARAAALIIGRVSGAAEQAGEKVSGDVLLHAGTEVFEDLANLSKVAKVKDFSTDQDALEGAYFRALDIFRGMLQEGGKLDKAAAAADLEKLAAMDKEGALEEIFRNLARSDGEEASMPERGAAPEEVAVGGGLMQGVA